METADYLNRLERDATEVERLRQRVAELEAQRWVPLPDGNYEINDRAYVSVECDGRHIMSVLDMHGVGVRLPANVRLCRLASPASDGEGSEG
jgi:hypothetical protein